MGYSNVAGDLNVYGTTTLSALTMNGPISAKNITSTGVLNFANVIASNLTVTNAFIVTATNTQVSNSISITNQGTTTALYVNQNEFPNMTYNVAEFWDHTQLAMVIDGNGNVAIHQASSPGYAFTVVDGASIDKLTLGTPLSISSGGTGTASGATQNYVFAGPSAGSAGAPLFRALVNADLPSSISVSNISANGASLYSLNSSNLVGNVANADVSLVVSQAAQPNITSVGTLTGLNVQGLLIVSNGFGISNINGANVSTVPTAQSVTVAAQTNITSVGTLTGLNVQGLLIASNGSGISNINGANVSTVPTAQSVTVAAQTNITSVGTLTGLNVQGLLIASNGSGISNINGANVSTVPTAQSVTVAAQTNITSVGTLSGLNVQGLLIASNGSGISNLNSSNLVGNVANADVALVVSQAAQPNITSVGLLSNLAVSNSLTTSNAFLSGNLNVQQTANIFVANIANIYTTNIVGFIGSQWTTGTGNIYYLSNVGIGTSAVSSNLTVVGNVYVSNAITTTNVFASSLTAQTGTFSGTVTQPISISTLGSYVGGQSLMSTGQPINTFTASYPNFLATGGSQFYFNDTVAATQLISTSGGGAFGISIAFSADGNTALVGANQASSLDGYAAIYRYTNGSWGTATTLTSTAGTGAQFGSVVALSADGNTALVSARPYPSTGYVAVFRYSNGSWGTATTLTSTSANATSLALSADGNTALVGAGTASGNAGYAAVFRYSGGSWGSASTLTSTAGATAQFGYSVALSADGNTALVGAPYDSTNAGYAVVFRYSNGSWGSASTLTSTAGASAYFGNSVDLSADGNTALVGAFQASSLSGYAAVFRYTSGSWGSASTLTSTAGTSSLFGASVSLSADGNTALVGAHFASSQDGYAAVFRYTSGSWGSASPLTSTAGTFARFGYSVALSSDGNTALVGASSGAGYAAVFTVGPKFLVNNTFAVYNGQVGIGTTTPTSNLAVVGNVYVSNTLSTGNLNVQQTANIFVANIANIYTTNIVGFIGSQWTTGTGNIYYLSNVGIGTSAVTANLSVTGNIYASNAIQTTNVIALNIQTSNLIPATQGLFMNLQSNFVLTGNWNGNIASTTITTSNLYTLFNGTGGQTWNAYGQSTGPIIRGPTANGGFTFAQTGPYSMTCSFATNYGVKTLAVSSNALGDYHSNVTNVWSYCFRYSFGEIPSVPVTLPFYVSSTSTYYYLDIETNVQGDTVYQTAYSNIAANAYTGSYVIIRPI